MSTDPDTRAAGGQQRRRRSKKAALPATTSITAAGLLSGGAAYATTGASPEPSYTACVTHGSRHALYHVTTGGTPLCHDRDTTITWNHTGPAGPQGVVGTGPAGLAGPRGATGPQGTRGNGPRGVVLAMINLGREVTFDAEDLAQPVRPFGALERLTHLLLGRSAAGGDEGGQAPAC